MSKIVCRIYFPFIMGSMVWYIENSVRCQVPHLGIPIVQVLFHTKCYLLGLVFAILHVLELGKGFLYGSVAMHTRTGLRLLFPSVGFYLLLYQIPRSVSRLSGVDK